jgi:2-iminobutanoate/2-iminopropanoate deaminase
VGRGALLESRGTTDADWTHRRRVRFVHSPRSGRPAPPAEVVIALQVSGIHASASGILPLRSLPMREPISTDQSPPPGGRYSQAVRWGELLFISGQTPRDLDRKLVDGAFRTQAERVYANVRELAAAGGATMADALRVTVYLSDLKDAAEADDAFAAAFPEPRPARTTIGATIPVAIEVDAVFGVSDPGS